MSIFPKLYVVDFDSKTKFKGATAKIKKVLEKLYDAELAAILLSRPTHYVMRLDGYSAVILPDGVADENKSLQKAAARADKSFSVNSGLTLNGIPGYDLWQCINELHRLKTQNKFPRVREYMRISWRSARAIVPKDLALGELALPAATTTATTTAVDLLFTA
jgi:hypothetical protein